MTNLDISFNENTISTFKNFIGKTFNLFKCDEFCYTPSVYGLIGLYIDGKPFKLTNFHEYIDRFGNKDDVAVFRFQKAIDSEIVSQLDNQKFIDIPINDTIEKINIINETQKLYKEDVLSHELTCTRGIIFFMKDGLEISFEKEVWFSEFITYRKGYGLYDKFESTNDFIEEWKDSIYNKAECSRNIIELS